MPIDFIKVIHRNVCVESLLSNRNLDFRSDYNRTTSEIYPTMVANYHNMKFTIKGKYLIIEGSLHKYWNDKGQNSNDFNHSDIITTIENLCSMLNLDASDFSIHQIEYGVNINLDFKSTTVLKHLIAFQNKQFCKGAVSKGEFYTTEFNEFRIKVYDKAKQYKLPNEIMRFEIHVKKMRYIKDLEISSLSDLANRSKLIAFGELLLNRWDDILLFDWTINKNELKAVKQLEFYYQSQCVNYWLDLNKNQRNKMKDKYSKMVSTYSNQVQNKLYQLIESKINLVNWS